MILPMLDELMRSWKFWLIIHELPSKLLEKALVVREIVIHLDRRESFIEPSIKHANIYWRTS